MQPFPLFFTNVNQPVTDPHRPPAAAAPAWGGFIPISEIPSHNRVSRKPLKNAFVSNICLKTVLVGGIKGVWHEPLHHESPSSWTPDPRGHAQASTAGPVGLSAKSTSTWGSWSALRMLHLPLRHLQVSLVLFQKLGVASFEGLERVNVKDYDEKIERQGRILPTFGSGWSPQPEGTLLFFWEKQLKSHSIFTAATVKQLFVMPKQNYLYFSLCIVY